MKRWWVRLLRYGGRERLPMAIILGATAAEVGLEALKPWPLKIIVDHALSGRPAPRSLAWLPGSTSAVWMLGWGAAATLAIFLVSWIVRLAKTYSSSSAGTRMTWRLAADVFESVQRLDLRFHRSHSVGDLARRVTSDCRCARTLVLDVTMPLFSSLATLAVMFVVMLRLDVRLTLVAMLVVPLLAVTVRIFSRPMSVRAEEELTRQGELAAMAEQTLVALPVVQAFGREPHESERFSAIARMTGESNLRSTAAQLRFRSTTTLVTALGNAAILGIGGAGVIDGRLTIGSLLVFISYLASLYAPLETLAYLAASVASASAGARRVFHVTDSGERVIERENAMDAPAAPRRGEPHVVFDRVSFGYGTGPVLHELTLSIGAAEKVAIIGPTGAGKSTLVSLIPRLFDVTDGRVLYAGADVRDVKVSSLRRQVAMLNQEPFILPVSIADNIAYARPDATREEIVAAAEAANAHAFISALPNGYDTIAGERGVTLSGGERQRIAIARAILEDAPLLILDEPTSAVDPSTEAAIFEALSRLTANRTTIIIAHRPSTTRNADRVVELREGRIVHETKGLERTS